MPLFFAILLSQSLLTAMDQESNNELLQQNVYMQQVNNKMSELVKAIDADNIKRFVDIIEDELPFSKHQLKHQINKQKQNLLHRVASSKRNRKQFAVHLLENCCFDVNQVDGTGATALHAATLKGNKEIIDVLLSYNANINMKDTDGCTALHMAAYAVNEATYEYLISCGADTTIRENICKLTALEVLYIGCEKIRKNLESTSLARGQLESVLSSGDNDRLRDVLKGRNLPAILNANDNSAHKKALIHVAAQNSNAEGIKYIVQAGAQVDKRDGQKRTALHIAAALNDEEAALTLLSLGADHAVLDYENKTPLQQSLKLKNPGVAQILLNNKAECSIDDLPPVHDNDAYFWRTLTDGLKSHAMHYAYLNHLAQRFGRVNIGDEIGYRALGLNPDVASKLEGRKWACAILGVSYNAAEPECTKAYRQLVLKWHPDRNSNAQKAAQATSLITQAKAILAEEK